MDKTHSDEKINVPVGSERVVHVRRLSKSSVTPLTVDTQINDQATELRQTKTHVRRRHRSDHHRYSSRTSHHSTTSGRKSHKHRSPSTKAWNTVSSAENHDGKRALSCLEMSMNEPVEAAGTGLEPSDGDAMPNPDSSKRKKSRKKSRSTELGSWLSLKSEPHADQSNWRYSNIFAPESPKVRPHKLRTSKSRSISVLPPAGSQIWSPFIPVPITYYPSFPYLACPKCGETPTVHVHSSNENFAPHSPTYVPVIPYQSYPSDMMYTQMRSVSMTHPPHHHHHHHNHHLPPTGRTGPSRSRTMPPAAAGGRNFSQSTVISTSADDMAAPDNEDYDRMIMEIEYAVANDEDPSNRMTPQTLQFILKVAKNSCKLVDLEQMAKQVKLILDKKFGEKWQVVVGDDSYGSYLASLPGALANFRINDLVFLIWQT